MDSAQSSSAHQDLWARLDRYLKHPDLPKTDRLVDGSKPERPAKASVPDVPPNRFGRYEILELLGEGGMGRVFLAYDHQLRRRVALKIPKFVDADPYTIERFYREARSAATLHHPNICAIHDLGVIDGFYYISMAYIEGKPLSAFVPGLCRLLPGQVAGLLAKVARALDEAHARGLIHRDLKPDNILLDQRQEPIVMDFGLARSYTVKTEPSLTERGLACGSPPYMSPEQVIAAEELTPATDIYSLGVVLYELLKGRTPFVGNSAVVFAAILHDAPPPVTEDLPDLLPDYDAICQRALAKDPQQRFASMGAFANALSQVMQMEAAGSRSSKLKDVTAMEVPVPRRKSSQAARRSRRSKKSGPRRSKRRGSWLLRVLIGVGLIGLGWLLGGPAGQPRTPAKPPPAHSPEALVRRPKGAPQSGATQQVTQEFRRFDQDKTGFLEPHEFPLHIIHRADQDGDARLSETELDFALRKLGKELFFAPPNPKRKGSPRQPRWSRPPR